jgi:3-dehydroquinate dehydratase/shikimate dehydrogenase
MAEVRLDLLGPNVPSVSGKELLVTYRNGIDLSLLPDGFNGMIDIGEEKRPDTKVTVVSSHHDHEKTPSAEEIVSKLNGLDGDIAKGAFTVNSFTDLHSIYTAASELKKKHVLLGMGGLGTVTRIRGPLLKNEFTFAYVGEPTAPGQLSLDEMVHLREDSIILGLLGHPISKTLSPQMQNAALKAAGISGIYLKFDSENIDNLEDVIREYNIRGMNVTIPFKEKIISHLDKVDADAKVVGAVNTVVNDNGTLTGYNTDILGIDKAMERAQVDVKGMKAVLMGSGGGARGCAYALTRKGCSVSVVSRNGETARQLAKDIGCESMPQNSVSILRYDMVVNCTPIGMYEFGYYPLSINQLTGRHVVFDMAYGKETPLIAEANRVGALAIPGEEMLIGQGSASFKLWTGQDQYETMRKAVLD